MNKEELFYEAERKTARPHKYSIRYKQKDETIYPSMVIRSQAEAIELLKKENQQLKKQKDELEKENNELQKAYELIDKNMYEFMKQKDDVVEFINKRKAEDDWLEVNANRLLRMLGEIDDNNIK